MEQKDWIRRQRNAEIARRICGMLKSPEEEVQCPVCRGTGQDEEHCWTDGTPASCEHCFGYGYVPKGDEDAQSNRV